MMNEIEGILSMSTTNTWHFVLLASQPNADWFIDRWRDGRSGWAFGYPLEFGSGILDFRVFRVGIMRLLTLIEL
ncbi:hypothetical protein YC2023_085661 [Brassica napus]